MTHIYTPQEFGLYAVILAALGLFGPALNLKFDMAVIVAVDESDLGGLVVLGYRVAGISTILVSVGYALSVLAGELNGYDLFGAALALYVMLIAQSWINIVNALSNSAREYGEIGSATLLRSVTSNCGFLSLGLLGAGAVGLVVSQIGGMVVSAFSQTWRLRERASRLLASRDLNLLGIASKYRSYPLFGTPSALLATSTFSSILIFVGINYSATEAGLYAIGYRLMGLPLLVLSANVARVYFEAASRQKNWSGDFRGLFVKVAGLLAAVVLPCMAMTAVIAPRGASLILGEDWTLAGQYVAAMTPLFAARLIADSLGPTFMVARRQGAELLVNCGLLGVSLGCFVFAVAKDWSLIDMLTMLSIGCAAVYISSLLMMFVVSGPRFGVARVR